MKLKVGGNILAVSILGIKEDFKDKIIEINKNDIDYIHLDIMDGNFVPNKTKEFNFYNNILKQNKKPLDIHLMVKDVISYIDEYKNLNPEFITFHIEAVKNPVLIIEHLKKFDIKIGIAISPQTDIKRIEPYLNIIDMVLVMSVEPGLGGQKFIENSIQRINYLKELKTKNDYNYLIEVDGGINDKTAKKASADILVVGSFITNSDNYKLQINKIKK